MPTYANASAYRVLYKRYVIDISDLDGKNLEDDIIFIYTLSRTKASRGEGNVTVPAPSFYAIRNTRGTVATAAVLPRDYFSSSRVI